MPKHRLSLGLDLSTQSLSVVVLDIDAPAVIARHSLNYVKDPRLNIFGIRAADYILPPRAEGEADQPPLMFLAALDAMCDDLKSSVDLSGIVVINTSGQQHGHVYLNAQALPLFDFLRNTDTPSGNLVSLLRDSLSYDRAPIWMTANTGTQANYLREAVGGKERLIQLSGSDAQLRFTGTVIRRTAEQFSDIYQNTHIIQLIGNFIPAVLAGKANVPADFGNACGMSLMNYRCRQWSDRLVGVISNGLPGGKKALRRKLSAIAAPDAVIGTIAAYFVYKYGFAKDCLIAAGSGDNPQSKVVVGSDLLSLGSSFVNMVATGGKAMDMSGAACAMYDGVGRPFMFGCRTNGALVWDQVRARYGMDREDYAPAEAALQQTPLGQSLVFWQPRPESFPASGAFPLTRMANDQASLGTDYSGIIESSLAAVYLHSRAFTPSHTTPLYIMGGAAGSPSIIRRIAAIWDRPVVVTGKAGAAMGAAIAGISAYLKAGHQTVDIDAVSAAYLSRGQAVQPVPEDVAAFHRPGSYLDRFAEEEAKLIKQYPSE
jgi:xylulokinase